MLVDSDSRFLMQNLMLVPKTLLGSIVRWISRDSRVTVCSSGIGPPYSRRRGLCCRDSCVAHETSTQSVSQHPWHKEGTVTSFKLLLPLCALVLQPDPQGSCSPPASHSASSRSLRGFLLYVSCISLNSLSLCPASIKCNDFSP